MMKECDRLGISVGDRRTSDRDSSLNLEDSESGGTLPATRGARRCKLLFAVVAAGMFVFCQGVPLQAQGQKSKIPLASKLSGGNRQQVYSGRIQSMDMKQRILNVESLHGRDTAIFPFKKNVRVEGINGNRMDLTELTPGTNVLIYFAQKSGERKIKNIVVLSSGKKPAKGKAPSS